MTTFVDTNVLIDLTKPEVETHQWSVDQIEAAKKLGPVYVSDIVYSEFSAGMESIEHTDAAINSFALARCGYSNATLFRAARAYLAYREGDKGGERKTGVLPDFLIGALAEVEGAPLLTRDGGKVPTYFPNVALIEPK